MWNMVSVLRIRIFVNAGHGLYTKNENVYEYRPTGHFIKGNTTVIVMGYTATKSHRN